MESKNPESKETLGARRESKEDQHIDSLRVQRPRRPRCNSSKVSDLTLLNIFVLFFLIYGSVTYRPMEETKYIDLFIWISVAFFSTISFLHLLVELPCAQKIWSDRVYWMIGFTCHLVSFASLLTSWILIVLQKDQALHWIRESRIFMIFFFHSAMQGFCFIFFLYYLAFYACERPLHLHPIPPPFQMPRDPNFPQDPNRSQQVEVIVPVSGATYGPTGSQ
jgi:hypothetical protein